MISNALYLTCTLTHMPLLIMLKLFMAALYVVTQNSIDLNFSIFPTSSIVLTNGNGN